MRCSAVPRYKMVSCFVAGVRCRNCKWDFVFNYQCVKGDGMLSMSESFSHDSCAAECHEEVELLDRLPHLSRTITARNTRD